MNVFSIFDSIDGEVNSHGQGHLTTFIRLAGCNLHCSYCDTKMAQDPEHAVTMTPDAILADIIPRKPYKVTITGGEPLMQEDELGELVGLLWSEHIFSTIETNGSYPIPRWTGCSWVADYKLKGSKVSRKAMDIKHFDALNGTDFIKFVISNRADYEEVKDIREKLRKHSCWSKLAFSPIMPGLNPTQLISWMQKDGLVDVLLNIQIHKLLDLTEDRQDPNKES